MVDIGKNVRSLTTSPQFMPYTKVHLDVSDTVWYESGTDDGRMLTLTNPWGTQEMCDNILDTVAGYAHQPFTADGAYIDPSMELWDDITVSGVESRIGSMRSRMGTMFVADIGNPGENAIDHEIPFTPKQDRKIMRELNDVRSTLLVQAGLISAKVEKTGGNESFSWDMNETAQVWKANGAEVFRLDKDGAVVTGEIRATTGAIGGFTIGADALRYEDQEFEGSVPNGIYIGTGGIQLGSKSDGFRVDSYGNLHAHSGSFTGSVNAGSIRYGGDYGKLNGSGISSGSIGDSRIIKNDLTTGSMVSAIGTSLANANYANSVCTGTKTSSLLKASSIVFDSHTLGRSTVNINGTPTKVVVWI